MSSPNYSHYSKILKEGFLEYYELPLGGKKVATPYRRNEYGSYQKTGTAFQGKSSAKTILEVTEKLAGQQHFDLDKASAEEIRQFMRQNKLGIDCSGFVYRMLDHLTQCLGLGNLQKAAGMEHVGRTNVAKMTSEQFSIPIKNFSQAHPGDIIRLNSNGDLLHGVTVLDNQDGIITYAHSSTVTPTGGVYCGEIHNGEFPQDLKLFKFNTMAGDGVKRLKILDKASGNN